jgi:predicted AlkP superfamily phosphohydrolase/phosphomutase
MLRRDFLKTMATVSGAALATSCSRLRGNSVRPNHRVLVVAFDGVDPLILKALVDAGRTPHLARLAQMGSFSRLRTSIPPHTPVAFSNIISGADASVHQIYDFIHRDANPPDPKAVVRPYFSTAEATTPEHQRAIPMGKWQLPLTGGETLLLRRGPAFWDYLIRAGIDTSIYYLPSNFPPGDPDGPGKFRCISGMGTPDLLGSYGEFTLFTPDAPRRGRTVDGGRFVYMSMRDHRGKAELPGPSDFLRKPDSPLELSAPVEVVRDPKAPVAKISIAGQVVLLSEGEWSDWMRVEFHSQIPGGSALGLLGAPTSIHGIARLLLKKVHPKLELYVSPVNIDPLSPINRISTPKNFAPQLAERYGQFYTTGIPEDTKALTNKALSEDQFLEQSEIVVSERVRQYRGALQEFQRGCMFFYFGATDLVQHMFWRDRDPQHPGRVPQEVERYEKVVEDIYLGIDEQVGDALDALDPEDTLIVMSDHGFTSFRRGFNLNSWLMENRFIKLSNPGSQGKAMLFGNTDWTGTRAYGVGLNGLYLNLKGRERHGTVAESGQRQVLDELRNKLTEVRDANGSQVIDRVDLVQDVFSGADPLVAPDLIVGYADGYRASWATVLGQMPRDVIEDNLDRWSGTHLTAPEVVPGMFVSNRQVVIDNPSISDIAPTILREFGLEVPSQMTGRPMF